MNTVNASDGVISVPKFSEEFIRGARVLHEWIMGLLNEVEFPNTERLKVANACFDLAIEHHAAMVQLVCTGMYGSAYALLRPQFESFMRGVWVARCAPDNLLARFIDESRHYTLGYIVSEVKSSSDYPARVIDGFFENSRDVLNSLTHGGFQQIARRIDGSTIRPNYDMNETEDILKFAGSFALMALEEIAKNSSRPDIVAAVVARLGADD